MKFLLYGGNGWIGSKVSNFIAQLNHEVVFGRSRVDDVNQVKSEIKVVNPDRIICMIGRTHGEGYSTIDYLEQKDKLHENIRDNLFGPLVLRELSSQTNIHLTYLGTGCIFNYDENHTETNGFNEDDSPNFFGSSYSVVKGFTDRLFHFENNNSLNVRIRMPISSDFSPRNFIKKITSYEKICSIPNSMTVLEELLPIMIDLSIKKHTGTVNLTNPGVITHNQILQYYKDIVEPEFTWSNFSIEEQSKILRSDRSNNYLDTNILKTLYPEINDIHSAVKNTLNNMKKSS